MITASVLVAATDRTCTGGAANPEGVGTTAITAVKQPPTIVTRIRSITSLPVVETANPIAR